MITTLIEFFDLDDGRGHVALYKALTLLGVWLAFGMAVRGAFWPAVSLFIAVLAASFGRNTFLRFLDRHSSSVSGKMDVAVTGSVKDFFSLEPSIHDDESGS